MDVKAIAVAGLIVAGTVPAIGCDTAKLEAKKDECMRLLPKVTGTPMDSPERARFERCAREADDLDCAVQDGRKPPL